MCGIAGKVSAREPVDRALVERMCEEIRHRGPDSRGVFCEGGVGLGIQRLRIIDLETGDQPIYNEDRSVVVVLNGEIYNYRELRAELVTRGHRFATASDTEVIVHLYEEHGDACVEHLRGMFAFALWDAGAQRLLLARDRVGKKPLFYAERDGALWFGSETRAILEDPEIPREMDFDAIDSFLRFQCVPQPKSAFKALRKLPPAHVLAWSQGQISLRRYWKLSYGPKDAYSSEDAVKERIREELLEATRLRLRSDVPLGAFLSGGVDSSAVVAAMAKQASGPVRTFSIGFDVASFDETRHAREVAELYGTDHQEFMVQPHALEILPKLIWHYGEPFADESAIPSFHLAELTRERVTVALNGDGGDESFAGYNHTLANLRLDRLAVAPRVLARLAARGFNRLGEGPRRNSPRSRARRVAHALSLTTSERYAMFSSRFTELDLAELYTPEFANAIGDDPLAGHVVADVWRESDATELIDRLLDVDVNTFLPNDLLVKMDIATMAHSLEVRSPLLDHQFMQMAARLPASLKLDGREKKRIFRDALRPWLPDHILDREKMGFGVPMAIWLRGPLRELPRDVLLDPRSLERGLFRPERVERIVDRHLSGAEDTSLQLWCLIQLELWLRTFVDSSRMAPPILALAR